MSDGKKEEKVLYDLHACMGLNTCKYQDRYGEAEMAGTGRCATVAHSCHGNNNCARQGGCGYLGEPAHQGTAGDNLCKGYGSCAVPINEGRITTEGFNKGKSVWRLARQLFEQRMYETGQPFGPSPGEGSPDDEPPPWTKDGSSYIQYEPDED